MENEKELKSISKTFENYILYMLRAKNEHHNIFELKTKKDEKLSHPFRFLFQYSIFFLNNVYRSMHNHLISIIIKDLILEIKHRVLDFFQKTINTTL